MRTGAPAVRARGCVVWFMGEILQAPSVSIALGDWEAPCPCVHCAVPDERGRERERERGGYLRIRWGVREPLLFYRLIQSKREEKR